MHLNQCVRFVLKRDFLILNLFDWLQNFLAKTTKLNCVVLNPNMEMQAKEMALWSFCDSFGTSILVLECAYISGSDWHPLHKQHWISLYTTHAANCSSFEFLFVKSFTLAFETLVESFVPNCANVKVPSFSTTHVCSTVAFVFSPFERVISMRLSVKCLRMT